MRAALVTKSAVWVQEWGSTLLGCGLLILGSYLKVPLYPVPFTMQTCALWIIALTMKPKQAVLAVILYLGLATAGLPVLGGSANSLWIIGKSGGYLIGFPLAVYVVASFKGKYASIVSIAIGHCIIYFLGFLVLASFVGASTAWTKGIVIFLPSAALKAAIAYFYKEKVHGHIF